MSAPSPLCICGKPFQIIQANKCYDVGNVLCDKCVNGINANDLVYHCSDGRSTSHSAGYDLCRYCALGTNDDEKLKASKDSGNGNYCFCGKPFQITKAIDCYSIGVCVCNGCSNIIDDADIIYHCLDVNSSFHHGGNDLCKKCGEIPKDISIDDQNIQDTSYSSTGLDSLIDILKQKGFAIQQCCIALDAAAGDLDTAQKYLLNAIPNQSKYGKKKKKPSPNWNSNLGTAAVMIDELIETFTAKNNSTCNGNIKTCPHLRSLKRILLIYSEDSNMNHSDIKLLLNNFYHLLFQHGSNEEFEFIYIFIPKCDLKKCDGIRRRNRITRRKTDVSREQKNDNTYSVPQSILDEIHCYYSHRFDVGHLLTSKEKNRVINIENAQHNGIGIVNKQIMEINKIILNKQMLNKDIITPNQHNKFNQLKNETKQQTVTPYFSFGNRFYYLKNQKILSFTKQFYVAPKYKSLKDEFINNNICSFGIEDWEYEYKKAFARYTTDYAKSMINATNQQIQLNHLISISAYCSYTDFAFQFSQTFRKLTLSESDDELKQRHSHFYFISRNISEAIHKFSVPNDYKFQIFYHGIGKNMLFDSMFVDINQPFSTTAVYEVAVSFSNKTGIVLETTTTGRMTYFNCAWLSAFPSECELLFLFTEDSIRINNITNIANGNDYAIFIEGISIIDTMIQSMYYSNDNGIVYERFKSIPNARSMIIPPKICGGKPISSAQKYCTIKIIKNELNKLNDNELSEIPPYIDMLFHHICTNKQGAGINLFTMNIEMVNDLNDVGGVGYCGYKFLEYLFCEHEIANMFFIMKLYPKLSSFRIFNVRPALVPKQLNNIWKFLSKNTDTIRITVIEIHLIENINYAILPKLMSSNTTSKYKKAGYNIIIRRTWGNPGLCIRKINSQND